MKKTNHKLLSCFLVVVLLLSLIPPNVFAVAASTTEVANEAELIAALEAGGEITITENINLFAPLVVSKDTVINTQDKSIQVYNTLSAVNSGSSQIECAFIISGATLTLNASENNNGMSGGMASVGYNGTNYAFKLVGVADKETKLIINGGVYSANRVTEYSSGRPTYSDCPQSLIYVETPQGAIEPSVLINDGSFSCHSPNNDYPESPMYLGPIVKGSNQVVIKGGSFQANPSAFLDSSYICTGSDGWGYKVYPISTEMSSEFASVLNSEGVMSFDRYKPVTEKDFDWFDQDYSESLAEKSITFHPNTYNPEDSTVYVSRYEGNPDNIVETHKVTLKFNYDSSMKAYVDGYISKLPEGKVDEWGYIEPYYCEVSDLALINYWMTLSKDEESEASLLHFSDEFKQYIDYKNFVLDCRMGWNASLDKGNAGMASFKYNGVVYGIKELGAVAENIIYVPSTTGNTTDALLQAAQSRIDEYLGETGIVSLSYFGTVLDAVYQYDYEVGLMDGYIEEGTTLEQYKAENPIDTSIEDINYYVYIEGVSWNDPCYVTTINGLKHYLLIRADSSKMATPSYQNVDVVTDVKVSSSNASIPLDTLIEVDKLDAGAEYERIISVLNVEENETFDIKLHSVSLGQYITNLDDGSFEVKIPVPAKFENKELIVYYVNSDNSVTEYPVTVAGGFATFTTNHFSIYTLAEKHTHSYGSTYEKDNTNHWKECSCGVKSESVAHTPKLINAKEATTSEKGYTGDTVCEICGHEIDKGKDIPVKVTSGDNKPTSPQTGDNSNVTLWASLLVVSALGLVCARVLGRKRKVRG